MLVLTKEIKAEIQSAKYPSQKVSEQNSKIDFMGSKSCLAFGLGVGLPGW